MARRGAFRNRLKRLLIGLPLAFVLLTTAQVLVLKWIDPVGSSFMAGRMLDAWMDGDWRYRVDYRWRDDAAISRQLPLAMVAAEDQRFPEHHGFDIEAMKKAYQGNQRGRKIRGGSTISAGLPNVNASVSYLHASLVSEEKSIRGSYMGSCVAERDIPRLLSLYRRGKMPVNKLKSGVVKLEEINEGFDRLSDGTVLRQMLKPNG